MSWAGRSPYGERGLKSAGYTSGGTVSLSRSPYGERGLKFSVIPGDIVDAASRSPYGERGLKSLPALTARPPPRSLPVRGAWIEIDRLDRPAGDIPSLPVRGAWIEIIIIWLLPEVNTVAPRTGSVD